MTLIIALSCKDGIVMASDGQATSGSSGGFVRRPISKIKQAGNKVLWGGSGSVGILQKISLVFEGLQQDILTKSIFDPQIKQIVIQNLFNIRKNELERHRGLYGIYGHEKEQRETQLADLLIAEFGENGNHKIWHINPDCWDELVEEFGYGCTGNGDIFAYSSLKNFNIKELSTNEGALLAYRVIKDAIDVGAFGLGEPIDVWILDRNGTKRLNKEHMLAIRDTCSLWFEAERETFKKILNKETETKK